METSKAPGFVAWTGLGVALVSVALWAWAEAIGAALPKEGAPTGDDYRNSCAMLFLYMGAFGAVMGAVALSAVGIWLGRTRPASVVAGVLGILLPLLPWAWMVVRDAIR